MSLSFAHIKELKRKSLHFSSIWIPCLYYFLPQETMVWLLEMVTAVVVVADIGRHFSLYLANLFYTLFGTILRPHELEPGRIRLTGASYVMLASLVVVAFFPKLIAVTALAVLMVSDCCAALIGKHYGKTPLVGEKTWEGTLAFLVSGWVVIVMLCVLFSAGKSYLIIAALAVCVGAVVELFSKKIHIDDNLTIPLSIAAFMWAVSHGVGGV
jgi:dolichol kinase